MILPRTDSVSKPLDSLGQKLPTFSRLTQKELEELHDTFTHYPPQKENTANIQSSSHSGSSRSQERSLKLVTKNSSVHLEKAPRHTEARSAVGRSREKDKGALHQLPESENSLAIPILDEYQKEDDLHFYHEKETLVDPDSLRHEVNRDHLPSASSLVGGAAALIGQVKSFFQPQQPSLSLGDDLSLTSIGGITNQISNESQAVSIGRGEVSLMEAEDPITNDLDLELDEQESGTKNSSERVGKTTFRNLERTEEVSTTSDAGDDTNFSGAGQEHMHQIANKLGGKENERSGFMVSKNLMTHTEIASATGSSTSSEAGHSDPVAAALRVAHLLDELTATVGRLRLESSDGKEMTIELRHDVLADTNVHIVATAKQMEVSFLTNNATSNLLLNTHLTTLQNHLNSLCPGQVVNVQTQLTSSSGSSHTRSEQEGARDDLASFDQGNRGNQGREE